MCELRTLCLVDQKSDAVHIIPLCHIVYLEATYVNKETGLFYWPHYQSACSKLVAHIIPLPLLP